MAYRGLCEKAHSPYWSLHVEAWRRSGLRRAEYCGRHGLKAKTFARWMKHLVGVEEARRHAEELREFTSDKLPPGTFLGRAVDGVSHRAPQDVEVTVKLSSEARGEMSVGTRSEP